VRWLPSFLFLLCVAHPVAGQDALRGKLLYHDIVSLERAPACAPRPCVLRTIGSAAAPTSR
jgi:hypothetical protein